MVTDDGRVGRQAPRGEEVGELGLELADRRLELLALPAQHLQLGAAGTALVAVASGLGLGVGLDVGLGLGLGLAALSLLALLLIALRGSDLHGFATTTAPALPAPAF